MGLANVRSLISVNSVKSWARVLGSAAIVALLSATNSSQASITLEDLLNGGSIRVYDPVNQPNLCYDLTFFSFHNLSQSGDLNVPLDQIFVDAIWPGPNEPGIRFSSAAWVLNGPNLHYDLDFVFQVKHTSNAVRDCLTGSTLRFFGGIQRMFPLSSKSMVQVSNTVFDVDSRAPLAANWVYMTQFQYHSYREDGHAFPGDPYGELEIVNHLEMTTRPEGGYVYVSRFDQTFSAVIPEANTSLSVIGLAAMAGITYRRRRVRASSKA